MPKMSVEAPPQDGRRLLQAEREYALVSWHRVVASDGSTIAYVPDRVTAGKIVRALLGE